MASSIVNGALTTMPAFADLRTVFGMNASDSTALMGRLRGLKAKHKQATVSQPPLPQHIASEGSIASVGSSTRTNTSIADAGPCSRADSAVCLASTRNSLETDDGLKKGRDHDASFTTANRRSRKISKPRGHPHRKAIFVDALLAAKEQGTSPSDGDEDAGSGDNGAQDDDSISVASTIHGGCASGVESKANLHSFSEMLMTLEGFPCDTRSASPHLSASERLDVDGPSAPRRLRNFLRKALPFARRSRPGRTSAPQSASPSFDPLFMADSVRLARWSTPSRRFPSTARLPASGSSIRVARGWERRRQRWWTGSGGTWGAED